MYMYNTYIFVCVHRWIECVYICSKICSLLKQNKVQKATCVYGSVIDNQRGILNRCGKVAFVGNCTTFFFLEEILDVFK